MVEFNEWSIAGTQQRKGGCQAILCILI